MVCQIIIPVDSLGTVRLPSQRVGWGPSEYYLCGPAGVRKITLSEDQGDSVTLLSLWTRWGL